MRLVEITLLFVLFSFTAEAEDHIVERSYKNTGYVPKIGLSWGNSMFFDLGIMRANTRILMRMSKTKEHDTTHNTLFFDNSNFSSISVSGIYFSTEIIEDESSYLFGPKIGYELASIAPTFASAIAIELKYYVGADNISEFAIAPKIGIPLGFFNIFYSYNFADETVQNITGEHIFSITFNWDYIGMKAHSKMSKEMNELRSRYQKNKNETKDNNANWEREISENIGVHTNPKKYDAFCDQAYSYFHSRC